MKIRYENMGTPIPQKQALSLGDYTKIYTLPNGMVKREDSFDGHKLLTVNYYKEEESNEEIRALLSPLNVSFGIRTIEEYGPYRVVHDDSYVENILKYKYNILWLANNKVICFEEINIETNLPLYDRTSKYLGHYEDESSTGYCKFHYNVDGSLNFCEYDYLHDYDSDEFDLKTIHLLKDKFVLSEDLYNYYLTAKLLPDLD
ncbi:hypothetical protein IDJ77_01585 [Mucilaginibacter sp. ZT4R22]|uniref:DKNYY family protein n=1 Tax=Mucilaginibacter pankratovii TaxID=2772110 RepID=A0ABR7WJI8_9SPHI|nr:hypothetical protein [Mucilaginibacter pankratovii]MBD1362489.1 hypothetical protein [Mucilaginibacter pankratovii]